MNPCEWIVEYMGLDTGDTNMQWKYPHEWRRIEVGAVSNLRGALNEVRREKHLDALQRMTRAFRLVNERTGQTVML